MRIDTCSAGSQRGSLGGRTTSTGESDEELYMMGVRVLKASSPDPLRMLSVRSTPFANVQRVSTTRAWRCLLLLGATGMLAVACSLHWRYSCVLLHASGFCAERSRTATTTAERYLVRVDAMGDGSQVAKAKQLDKVQRRSVTRAWCCLLLVGAVAL